jgi:hypothetical protein
MHDEALVTVAPGRRHFYLTESIDPDWTMSSRISAAASAVVMALEGNFLDILCSVVVFTVTERGQLNCF